MLTPTQFESSFFTVSESQPAVVVTLTRHRLTEEENLDQFDHDIMVLLERFGIRHLAVDLTSITYLNSSAIGKFISLHRRMGRDDGQLVLCGLQPEVAEILTISHLMDYFRITQTAEQAVARLSAGRK